MSDAAIQATPVTPKPKRGRPPKSKAKAAAEQPQDPTPPKINEGIFAGITVKKCPDACTPEHCVISTVNVCKHPLTCSASGCGPVTLANREKAIKILKLKKLYQEIE